MASETLGRSRSVCRIVLLKSLSGHASGFAVDVSGLARAFGCPARRVSELDDLLVVLDEVLPGLGGRGEPLLLEVVVAQDSTFAP